MRLFVYGSLKSGMRHHAQLLGARRIAATSTAGGYQLVLAGEYPALVRLGAGAASSRVAGELYEVDAKLLAELDGFEGCPEFYQRERIELEDGSLAYAYVMQATAVRECPSIPDGVWRERLD